ncbi:MAG: transposase family protein, partial [Planctomycetota bacterium]
KFCCPECQEELACYDHAEERRWRHLDLCQFKTILIGRVPRVNCPDHGVKTVTVPWALSHSRFTLMFERFAIEVLLMTQTVKGAMTILRLNWDATWNIIERAVAREKARKEPSLLPQIGIDEKAFAKGRKYVSILYNLDNSTVEAIEEGHDTEAAKSCFSQLSVGALKGTTHGRFAGGIFWFFCTLAPFGAIASDGTDPVGALSSVAPFAPDRRNSLATDFLSMPSARAICRWLIPEAKSCVIPCVLSIESLFSISDSSTEVTKHPLKKSTASSLSNWPLLKAP